MFLEGRSPEACPAAEPGACGQTAAGPEAALRLALRYSPQGGGFPAGSAGTFFRGNENLNLHPKNFRSIWQILRAPGKDMTAGIPGRNRSGNRQRILYDEADFTDWKENQMSTIGVYDPEPGTCFRIYRAAELLYRLAAIGGNLRALEGGRSGERISQ